MKKVFCCFLIMVSFVCQAFAMSFVVPDSIVATAKIAQTSSDVVPEASSLKKLTFFEKIGSIFNKKQTDPLTGEEIRKANSNATTGFIFSLLGILVLPLFAIPGLIISKKALNAEKVQPETLTSGAYTMAKAARVMGWIGIALLIILVPLIVLAIALGNWH